LPPAYMQKIFEPIGHGTVLARVHENENVDLEKTLFYEIDLPVRCLLDLPDHPTFQNETSISLSLIRIGLIGWQELSGRSFAFPVNPANGYVDGSVYFSEQHHYVDLIGLRFGRLCGDVIETDLEMIFNFYPISEVPNLPSQIQMLWTVMLRLDVGVIEQAIRQTRQPS
jgi:hypothetical protein